MDKDLRRLVVTALALIVFLFVGRVVVGSVFDDDAARRQARLARGGLSGAGASRPDGREVARMRALRDTLHEQLLAVVPRLGYERPPEFDVPAGRSADLHFLDVLRREQQQLVQEARYQGKSVPLDLGMPVPNPTGTEDVLAALRSLHVVHLVVSAALAADCSAVDSIQRVVAPRRRQAGLLRIHGVQFDLRGGPQALQRLLAALTTSRPYLALDDVRIEALDEDGETLRCRLVAALVTLDQETLDELEVSR